MKVKDLINQLNHFKPEDEIVLKARDGREFITNLKLRVYSWEGRAVIDGYHQEQKA